ncbi:unnamed protein product [Arabidopsis thaliana]|uniref:Hyaluronan/mRNA-binding protein domain-containing protein n=1 Tax=Arabidopsis thaliana TaxID=3702 RepID=A0A5S9XTC1_ARATH|nr:nuclear RNA binding protein A-like protein [Arabidopsis thaliana]CAA0395604.1 unnamed protein product [Arabidopsis thaliana]
MASVNPFDLLDDDAEDPSQIVASKPLKVVAPVQTAKSGKMPTKPPPPSQAVREARNAPGGGRGAGRGGSYGRGGRGGNNRDSRNNDGPANENGYGGGYRRSEEGDGARRGGPVGGYRGDRRGSYSNGGDSGDSERPRKNYDRHSRTAYGNEEKRDGAGRANWGTPQDDITPVTEESTAVVDKNLTVEKQDGEGEATDAKNETPAEKAEEKPEDKEMTLEEYEKVLEEKKKALQATKVEERKVDTKAFEAMQQLSSKKSNNDEVFIKLGTEKDKRITEREEKTRKSLSINEFLKPADGKSYYRPRGGYQGGREGRGPREGNQRDGGRNQREGGRNQRDGGAAAQAPTPAIGDSAQFPTLGK